MFQEMIKRVEVSVKKVYYTNERYETEATFALLHHKQPLSIIELSKHVRISDQLIQIDDNRYFIIFSYTSANNAYKAAQNMIYSLDNYFGTQSDCSIALDSFDPSKSAQSVLNRLELILAETIKKPYIRIETEEIFDRKSL